MPSMHYNEKYISITFTIDFSGCLKLFINLFFFVNKDRMFDLRLVT